MWKSKKILFQISGSIAAFKAATVVSQLVQRGNDVKVVFSNNAHRFIGASTFEGLTGHPVYQDTFDALEPMAHIDLARWADVMVLCPASANVLAQLAHGFAQDLIGTLFLAREAQVPYLVFPAMNVQMWNAEAVKNNCAMLGKIANVRFIHPASGGMACGEIGEGRLPEPEDILKEIEATFQNKDKNIGRVLITGGGTSEPIDDVRFITNFSTGKTSVGLAEHLKQSGFEVDLLLSQSATAQPKNVSDTLEVKRFTTHSDLEALLKSALLQNHYKAVIHLAAVSDYQLKNASQGKISSDHEHLHLDLVPTRKLVHHLRNWSQDSQTKIVAFKLTSGSKEEERLKKAQNLLERDQLDAVVVNDLKEINSAHPGILIRSNADSLRFETKTELYQTLENLIKEEL